MISDRSVGSTISSLYQLLHRPTISNQRLDSCGCTAFWRFNSVSRKPEPYGPPTTESLKGEAASPSCHIHLLFSTPQGTKASWHRTSITKMARFVLVVILLVALIVDGSLSFMGWFGNSGKKPNGRRSVIKVSCRQNWTSFNLLLECKLLSDSELRV